jgi:iron(III) transport system permease protein
MRYHPRMFNGAPGMRERAWTLGVVALLMVFLAWPLALVLGHGLLSAGTLAPRFVLALLARSLLVAAVSSLGAVVLGSALAYAVVRAGVPRSRFVVAVVRLAMVAPPFLASVSLLLLLGDDGLLVRVTGFRIGIEGFFGVVLAQIVTVAPYVFMTMARGFRQTDGAPEEAALSLGANEPVVFRRITLALARPALIRSWLAALVRCLGDFANPFLIGGGLPLLATEIYGRAVDGQDAAGAAALGVVLLASCLLAWSLRPGGTGDGQDEPDGVSRSGAGRIVPGVAGRLLTGLAGASAAVIAALYAAVAAASVVGPTGMSLAHYGALLAGAVAGSIILSVRLALLAAATGAVLAVVMAAAAGGRRPSAGWLIERAGLVPAALPGPVLGLGYLLAVGRPATIWILVASVVVWKLPRAVAAATRVLGRRHRAAEEVAVSLGASRARVLRQIILPGLTPALAAAFGELFVGAMVTVNVLALLATPELTPGAVAALLLARRGELGLACAVGTVLVGLVLAAGAGARFAARQRAA